MKLQQERRVGYLQVESQGVVQSAPPTAASRGSLEQIGDRGTYIRRRHRGHPPLPGRGNRWRFDEDIQFPPSVL